MVRAKFHKSRSFKILTSLAGITVLQLLFLNADSPHRTGLLPTTPEEIKKLQQRKVIKVKPNRLAIERRNQELAARNLPLIDLNLGASTSDEASSVLDTSGSLNSASLSGSTSTTTTINGTSTLSSTVDNSLLPSFPPIGNQGNESSCTTWGTTYYQMSHEVCLVRGCNNKTIGATTFSPKWTYNMINFGNDGGSYMSDAFNLLQNNGAADLISLPYVAGDYRAWDLNPGDWLTAMSYKMNPIQAVPVSTTYTSSTGLDNVKQLLANGHVLTFATYVNSWVITRVGNDPSAPSPYAGQYASSYMNGTSGGHVMTIVGYDDSVWIDINGNGVVDPGEKGAFKIANSWGGYWNSGFIWLAYDSVYSTTSVSGGPTNKIPVFSNSGNAVYLASAKASYAPTLVAQFTINSGIRNQMRMIAGTSSATGTSPSTYVLSSALQYQGGPYAFDGSTTPIDGTFLIDLSSLVSSTSTLNYYLSASSSSTSGPVVIKDYRLLNMALNSQVVASGVPTTASGSTVNIPINYSYSNGKSAPAAIISATSSTSSSGVTVSFDGSGSTDPNSGGSISSYTWNFGDGSLQQTGSTATHLYTSQGNFTATLTVTDNFGLSGTASYAVSIADTIAPTAPSNLSAALGTVTSGRGKKATTSTVVNLSWGASTDNVGVSQYKLYRNGSLLTSLSSSTLSYQDKNTVSGGGTYTYTVVATDAAGNVSNPSNTASVTR